MSADRTFTLHEAQALLPTLSGLLQNALAAHRHVEEIDQEMQRLLGRILLCGGVQCDPIHTTRLRAERDRDARRVQELMEEITASGVQIKDLDTGLLDFPCLWRGSVVLLCWKLGEPAIEHWHGSDEGFANRKPIEPSMFAGDRPPRVH